MDESKQMAAQQQRQRLLQEQQQQHLVLQHRLYQNQKLQQRQQELFLLGELEKQEIQEQQQAAMLRFPSNIDVHLRPRGYIPNQPVFPSLQNVNPTSGLSFMQHNQNFQNQQNELTQQMMMREQIQQQRLVRPSNNLGIQFSYQDAWRACNPDFKRPFASLEDACERLLPYHVVADYEAEEEDRIINSDTTGKALSRGQQWDNDIAAKVAKLTETFENQAKEFNRITQKRGMGELRAEESLMIERALLHEERTAFFELKAEMDREKAVREAQEARLRMVALAQAGQVRAGSQCHAEIMARNPFRGNAAWNQVSHLQASHEMGEQRRNMNPDEMMNRWRNNNQRDKEPLFEDFLNDEENENGEMGEQEKWRGSGELDLNIR